MAFPRAADAFVPLPKVRDYLLNLEHPEGGSKARWLLSIGYKREAPDQLIDDLLSIAQTVEEYTVEQTKFGTKYHVVGDLGPGRLRHTGEDGMVVPDAPSDESFSSFGSG